MEAWLLGGLEPGCLRVDRGGVGPAAGIRTPDRPVSARPPWADAPSSTPFGGVWRAGGLHPAYSRALCR